jgi:hypothetical protein
MTDHRYSFFIETYTGERTEWAHLTKTAALTMYRTTDKGSPDNVKRYGWADHTEGYAEPVDEKARA